MKKKITLAYQRASTKYALQGFHYDRDSKIEDPTLKPIPKGVSIPYYIDEQLVAYNASIDQAIVLINEVDKYADDLYRIGDRLYQLSLDVEDTPEVKQEVKQLMAKCDRLLKYIRKTLTGIYTLKPSVANGIIFAINAVSDGHISLISEFEGWKLAYDRYRSAYAEKIYPGNFYRALYLINESLDYMPHVSKGDNIEAFLQYFDTVLANDARVGAAIKQTSDYLEYRAQDD